MEWEVCDSVVRLWANEVPLSDGYAEWTLRLSALDRSDIAEWERELHSWDDYPNGGEQFYLWYFTSPDSPTQLLTETLPGNRAADFAEERELVSSMLVDYPAAMRWLPPGWRRNLGLSWTGDDHRFFLAGGDFGGLLLIDGEEADRCADASPTALQPFVDRVFDQIAAVGGFDDFVRGAEIADAEWCMVSNRHTGPRTLVKPPPRPEDRDVVSLAGFVRDALPDRSLSSDDGRPPAAITAALEKLFDQLGAPLAVAGPPLRLQWEASDGALIATVGYEPHDGGRRWSCAVRALDADEALAWARRVEDEIGAQYPTWEDHYLWWFTYSDSPDPIRLRFHLSGYWASNYAEERDLVERTVRNFPLLMQCLPEGRRLALGMQWEGCEQPVMLMAYPDDMELHVGDETEAATTGIEPDAVAPVLDALFARLNAHGDYEDHTRHAWIESAQTHAVSNRRTGDPTPESGG